MNSSPEKKPKTSKHFHHFSMPSSSSSILSSSIDNSMQKSLLEKRKQKLYLEYLMKEKNRIIGRSEIRKMHEILKQPKKDVSIKAAKLKKRADSATKIQKAVRGWLVRKQYESEFISISKKVVHMHLQEISNDLPSLLLFGRNCLEAALRIQKAFRYFKLKVKITWLKRAYEIMIQNNVKAQAKRFLRRFLKTCIYKARVFSIREELSRKNSLFAIRMRMALLSIKNFMTRNNLSLSDITLAYRVSRWAKMGINILDSKNNSPETEKRRNKRPKVYSRVYFHSYKPVLSERASIDKSNLYRANSRLLEPTQASSSRTRIKFYTGNGFHKRNQSDYSIYSKPTRPCTPFR
jgi:hypothetical protein